MSSTTCSSIDVHVQVPKEFRSRRGGDAACQFWETHGYRLGPALKLVAQSVLGVPPSVAVLERDFLVPSQVISRKRRPMDGGMAEVLLFLRAQYQDILNDVPQLSEAETRDAIPLRLPEK